MIPRVQNRTVTIPAVKDLLALGITLTGGDSKRGIGLSSSRSRNPIRIKGVAPGSLADRNGRIRVGDVVLRLGNVNLHGATYAAALAALLRAPRICDIDFFPESCEDMQQQQQQQQTVHYGRQRTLELALPSSSQSLGLVLASRHIAATTSTSASSSTAAATTTTTEVVFIADIADQGVVDLDGRLRCGDRIIAIDGHAVPSLQEARTLLAAVRHRVLLITVDAPSTACQPSAGTSSAQQNTVADEGRRQPYLTGSNSVIKVVLKRNGANAPFGLRLTDNVPPNLAVKGVFIDSIVPGSIADQYQREYIHSQSNLGLDASADGAGVPLQYGDALHSINGVSTANLTYEQCLDLVCKAEDELILELQPSATAMHITEPASAIRLGPVAQVSATFAGVNNAWTTDDAVASTAAAVVRKPSRLLTAEGRQSVDLVGNIAKDEEEEAEEQAAVAAAAAAIRMRESIGNNSLAGQQRVRGHKENNNNNDNNNHYNNSRGAAITTTTTTTTNNSNNDNQADTDEGQHQDNAFGSEEPVDSEIKSISMLRKKAAASTAAGSGARKSSKTLSSTLSSSSLAASTSAAAIAAVGGSAAMGGSRMPSPPISIAGDATEDDVPWAIGRGRVMDVVIVRDHFGLGFGIQGGVDTPEGACYVASVSERGAASSKLVVGDKILMTNAVSLLDLTHEQAVNMLRQANKLNMMVYRGGLPPCELGDVVHRVSAFTKVGTLGISILGGINTVKRGIFIKVGSVCCIFCLFFLGGRFLFFEFCSLILFVCLFVIFLFQNLQDNSPALLDGKLARGDQLLSVNGTSLLGLTHTEAATLLRGTPPRVS